jgi:hypothetical protein
MIPCTRHTREIKELQEQLEGLQDLIKVTAEGLIAVSKTQREHIEQEQERLKVAPPISMYHY